MEGLLPKRERLFQENHRYTIHPIVNALFGRFAIIITIVMHKKFCAVSNGGSVLHFSKD
jgi:hypothetical protein